MKTLAKTLGSRIVELRMKRGLTAERLAQEMQISKGYLSDIENGKKLPTIAMLARLAKVLKFPLREFF